MSKNFDDLLRGLLADSAAQDFGGVSKKLRVFFDILLAPSSKERRPYTAADKMDTERFLKKLTRAPWDERDLPGRVLVPYQAVLAASADPSFELLHKHAAQHCGAIAHTCEEFLHKDGLVETPEVYERGNFHVHVGGLR